MLDLSLFIPRPESSLLWAGHYDASLVSLSVAVAVFASYAYLLVSQLLASQRAALKARWAWVAAGGLGEGVGIWAMHFVGMLAFSLPCTTAYSPSITLLSMLPSIVACMVALVVISRPSITGVQWAMVSLLLGGGIGSMHYTGMAAMRLDGMVRYDLGLFLLSVAVAVALAAVAIGIKFRLQHSRHAHLGNWGVLISAVFMGLAVSGMHYVAMAATYFVRSDDVDPVEVGLAPTLMSVLVLAVTGLMILLVLVATFAQRARLVSLQRSYPLALLLVAGWGFSAWLSSGQYYGRLSEEQHAQELQIATQQAKDGAAIMEAGMGMLRGAVGLVAVELAASDLSVSSVAPVLRRLVTNLPLDDAFVVDSAGACVADADAGRRSCASLEHFAQRAFFMKAKAGSQSLEYAVDGPAGGELGLYVSSPITVAGRFLGVLVAKRNLDHKRRWIRDTTAWVADENGVIVLSAERAQEFRTLPDAKVHQLPVALREAQYGKRLGPPLDLSSRQGGRTGVFQLDGTDQQVLVVSEAIPEAGTTVYSSRSLNDLDRLGPERITLFALITAVGAMAIISVFAVALYWRESSRTRADLRIAATAFESNEPMIITDAEGVILRANQAYFECTGYAIEEVIGQNPRRFKSDRHDAAFFQAMWQSLLQQGFWRGEVWDLRKNGDVYLKDLTITAVRSPEGDATHYVGMHIDITQRKEAEREIENLAFYDPLTKLPNRRLLRDRLQQALVGCRRGSDAGALLFIDLDNFKVLNDTRGHAMGDLLLQQVGQRLTACVRQDDVVARLGGDEFVAMLHGLSSSVIESGNQARMVGEKILAALNQPYSLAGETHYSTCSIGIALFPDNADTVEELLKRADVAMYQAKNSGRNALCFFDPDMQSAIMAQAAVEADLREGLHSGQFVLFYQGQVDHRQQLIGAEALVRWRHPRRGMVSPAEFIPLAEETGLIVPLGQWVLESACRQLVTWRDDPRTAGLVLSVNVSSRQFRSHDFVPQVLAVLDRTKVDPHLLKFEITESLMLKDVPETIQKMEVLKARGVGFSIDDFGMGYSSLSYLRRLPLDQLKIDKSYVQDVFNDVNDAAIVRTIVALARSLGLEVVAEGVETDDQRDFLAANGCNIYQGYLFSRPGPAEDLLRNVKAVSAKSEADLLV
ncbi:MAG: hypothetical protein RLZZ126_857 [Pseudomonadota bacterium]|jgi:diguanylate cyclase (GGDEF)-like protein/PAS domain S-box-containing protein